MTKKQYIQPSVQVLCINNPSLVIQVAVRAIMRENARIMHRDLNR